MGHEGISLGARAEAPPLSAQGHALPPPPQAPGLQTSLPCPDSPHTPNGAQSLREASQALAARQGFPASGRGV